MNGDFFDIKLGFSAYLKPFYAGVYADTPAIQEFAARGINRSVIWAPDRMVDAVSDMLAAYQKNNNSPTPNAGSLLPVIMLAMAKDYIPVTGDWGGRQVGRQIVKFSDDPGAKAYGYRQAMGEIRLQIVVLAPDSMTSRSLAAQLGLFIGEIPNRRFYYERTFDGNTLLMPVMLETPDVLFSNTVLEQPNISALVCDLSLKAVIPYFDTPLGETLVSEVEIFDYTGLVRAKVVEDSTTFQPFDPLGPFPPNYP